MICLLLLSGWFCPGVWAADKVLFFLEDEPIYTSSNPVAPGFLLEVVSGMMESLKLEPELHFLPWKRAQLMALKTPNAVIFPLSRTPARENRYLWLSPVFEVPVMFVTLGDAPVIDSFETARKVRGIGVIMGTPQEAKLKAEGVEYISLTGKQIYPALADGRVNAIFSAQPEAMLGWKQFSNGKPLRFGPTLQTLPLWIAASKASNRIRPEDWVEALARVKASGRFDELYQRYFGQ